MPEPNPTVGMILTVRMGSSRLPGKALLPLRDIPMIGFMAQRISRSKLGGELIIATTTNPEDDCIEKLMKNMGFKCYRGDEKNVLQRFIMAAEANNIDIAVRLYGDSPITDPLAVDLCIENFLKGEFDIVTTKYLWPMGIDCEVIKTTLLRNILNSEPTPMDLEHVTHYIWRNRKKFRGFSLPPPKSLNRPEIILTVDDHADYERLKLLCNSMNKTDFTSHEAISWLDSKPEFIQTRDVPQSW